MTIPCSTALEALAKHIAHPGLFFDRYMAYENDNFNTYSQELQRPHLEDTVKKNKAVAEGDANPTILKQWLPPSLSLWIRWRQTTIWRMVLHLSRAASTENASVCLHPVYGFPYIPGTGLKGMTRAYAHLVLDKKEDDKDIQRIFGNLSRGAGTVIFHDAWPEKWPKLELDIVNSHHPEYYKKKGEGSPPGDWENPVPVYFLAIAPGSAFRFAITPRSAAPQHIADAKVASEWLQTSLQEMGAGGKTAAGYGYFDHPIDPQERLAILQSGGADAVTEALQRMEQLQRECADAGGYTHTKHFERLETLATALRDVRGNALIDEDVQRIKDIAGEKAQEKRIRQLIRKLSNL